MEFASQFDSAFDMLVQHAQDISEHSIELGSESALDILRKNEASMRQIIDAQAFHQANTDTLSSLASQLQPDTQVTNLQGIFEAAVQKKLDEARSRGEVCYDSHPKYKEFQQKIKAFSGGGAADEETAADGDEDVQMTQETIVNFNCPILQIKMTHKGEMRPMTHPECSRCVFSYKGILDYFKKAKSKPCPTTGCNRTIKVNELIEHKQMAMQIKRAQEAEQDEPQTSSAAYVR